MFFDDWKKQPPKTIDPGLLWEYDVDSFTPETWKRMRVTVVHRVIERGTRDDWYAMFQLYGGPRKVKRIIKKIPEMQEIDINFVKTLFNLKDYQLRCCRLKQ